MSEQKKRPKILRRDDSFTATIDTGASSNFMLRSVPAGGQGGATPVTSPATPPEPAAKSAPKPPSQRQKEPQKAEEAAAKSELIKLNFTIPAKLAQRAETMAVAAKCPARRVASAALNQLKPELLAAFTSVKYSDIDTTRQSDVGMRISTSWVVSAEVMAALLRELDPLAVGQVNSLLSAWVRDRFTQHFDGYLATAGF